MTDFEYEVNDIIESYVSEFDYVDEMGKKWDFDTARKISDGIMRKSEERWKNAKGLDRDNRISEQNNAAKSSARARRINPGDPNSKVDRGIYGIKKAFGKNGTFQK